MPLMKTKFKRESKPKKRNHWAMNALFGSVRRSRRRSASSSTSSNCSASSQNSAKSDRNDIDPQTLKSELNSEDFDLEQKIDLEVKMQEGTTKLLAACKHQIQALEAAKSLLTSNERMNAYVLELQRRKSLKQQTSLTINRNSRFTQSSPSLGKVAITDIRMPLIWKDSDHFKNKGDCRRFAVFCLLKLGTEVQDTAMVTNVDRSMTDIAFEDVAVFNQAPHDFEFRLEVYSYMLHEDLTMANASNKLKKKISYSVSKAIGKKMAINVKEDITLNGHSTRIPGLDMVAHATLRLEDACSRIKTYDLVTENLEKSKHQLPLFGHFCCKMAVQPDCMVEETYSGYLSHVHQIGNLTGSKRMWSSLKGFNLSMWANTAEIHGSSPDIVIPIKQGTQLTTEDNTISYPRYNFRLSHAMNGDRTEYLLAADSTTELNAWVNNIRQQLQDYDSWKPASESLIDMPSPTLRKHSQFISRSRHISLYDETPFSESAEDPPSPPHSNASSLYDTVSAGLRANRVLPFRSSSCSSSSTSNSFDSVHQHQRPRSMLCSKTTDSFFQF